MKYDEKLLDTLDKMEMNMEKLTDDELKRISALQKEKMNVEKPKSKKIKWKIKQFAGIAAACVIIVGSTLIFIQSHVWNIGETKNNNIITQEDIKSEGNKDDVGIASIDNSNDEQNITSVELDIPTQTEVITSNDNDNGLGIASNDDSNDQQNITSVEPEKMDSTKEITTGDNIGIASVDGFDSQQNTESIICDNFDQAKEILGYAVMIPAGTLDELSRGGIKVIDKKILEINYSYKNSSITYRTAKESNYLESSVVDDNEKRRVEFKKEDRSFSMDIDGDISEEEIIKIIDSIQPY